MVFDWEWLCEKVCFVQIASFPDNSELAIGYSISDPVVAHGSCLEFFYLRSLVGGVVRSCVVGYDDRPGLRVSYAGEDILKNASSLGHDEDAGVFGFADGGGDVGDDLGSRTYPMVVTFRSFS